MILLPIFLSTFLARLACKKPVPIFKADHKKKQIFRRQR